MFQGWLEFSEEIYHVSMQMICIYNITAAGLCTPLYINHLENTPKIKESNNHASNGW